MILRFLFFLFVAYLLYKLVFDFIIPIYRTTKQVKKGFREMHERMHQQMNGAGFQEKKQQPEPNPNKNKKATPGDYIEFEELKD